MFRLTLVIIAGFWAFDADAETRLGVRFDARELSYNGAANGLAGMTNDQAIIAMRKTLQEHGDRSDLVFLILSRIDPACIVEPTCDDQQIAADRARSVLRRIGSEVAGHVRDLRFDIDTRAVGDTFDVVELVAEPNVVSSFPDCATGISLSERGLPPRRNGTTARPAAFAESAFGYQMSFSGEGHLAVAAHPSEWRYISVHRSNGTLLSLLEIAPGSGTPELDIPAGAAALRLVRSDQSIPALGAFLSPTNTRTADNTRSRVSPDTIGPSIEIVSLPPAQQWELAEELSATDLSICTVVLLR